MRKSTVLPVVVSLLLIAAVVLAVVLRKNAPPEAARLLPESDAIVYLNLKPLRAVTHFDRKPVEHDPDYQRFIDATGIEFERDLDEAAFAIEHQPNPLGPNGPLAYSEVFVGRFNSRKLATYLSTIAAGHDSYVHTDIYLVPQNGRTVRVALLGYDMVAVSNTPTAEQIHAILDRYHSAALPFSGSSLLKDQYSNVPLLSLAWGIARIGPPNGLKPRVHLLGFRIPLPVDTTFVASLRFVRSLQLRVEEIAPGETVAAASAGTLNELLELAKTAERLLHQPSDPDLNTLLQSITVEHQKNRAVMKAVIPPALLQRTLEAPVAAAPAGH